MILNGSNSSLTQNIDLRIYDTENEKPNYLTDPLFGVFFIIIPLFFLFCVFILWWDSFYGTKLVPNCIYFILDWGNDSRCVAKGKGMKCTSHEEMCTCQDSEAEVSIYDTSFSKSPTPNRSRFTHSKSPAKRKKIVERVQNPRRSHLLQQTKGISSQSPSLPPMLEHETFSYSMKSQLSKTPSYQPQTQPQHPQHVNRIAQKQGLVPHRTAQMKYRDPGSSSSQRRSLRRTSSNVSDSTKQNNVVLSKLSIERRPPPIWDKSYSRRRTSSDDQENDASDDLSERSLMLKAMSHDMKRRMSTLFPEEDLRRFSLIPADNSEKMRTSLKLMQKTQSTPNVLLKRRLSHFCPPESRESHRHSLPPDLPAIPENPKKMAKSFTCDVLKSKLGDFIPQETPTTATPSSVPTRTPSNPESREGLSTRMSTHPQPAASAFNKQKSQVQSNLESELKEIEERIQRARGQRRSFTKEELTAKLQEFVPHPSNRPEIQEFVPRPSNRSERLLVEHDGRSSSIELPSENIDISDLKQIKSDIVRSKSSDENDRHFLYHQRSNTWQTTAMSAPGPSILKRAILYE